MCKIVDKIKPGSVRNIAKINAALTTSKSCCLKVSFSVRNDKTVVQLQPAQFQDDLKEAVRGGKCQNGRVKCAVRWAGWSRWWGESQRNSNTTSTHPSSIYIGCTEQTHNQIETHGHTVRHSKINAVRTTMIPLHYLHTGPPSHTRLPHCPLHGSSVEVVITKANISCSLCF